MEIDTEPSTQACAVCGIVFSIPTHFETTRRNNGSQFFCPNGHSLVFNSGKTIPGLQIEVDRLTSENSNLKKENVALRSKIDQLEAKFALKDT